MCFVLENALATGSLGLATVHTSSAGDVGRRGEPQCEGRTAWTRKSPARDQDLPARAGSRRLSAARATLQPRGGPPRASSSPIGLSWRPEAPAPPRGFCRPVAPCHLNPRGAPARPLRETLRSGRRVQCLRVTGRCRSGRQSFRLSLFVFCGGDPKTINGSNSCWPKFGVPKAKENKTPKSFSRSSLRFWVIRPLFLNQRSEFS